MKSEYQQIQVDDKWLDNPVFILSIGKTGTTLLLALFDGHEEVLAIPEETDYFDSVHTPLNTILQSPLLGKEKRINKITKLWLEDTHLRLFNGVKRENSFATGNVDYSNFNFKKFKELLKQYLREKEVSYKTAIAAVPFAYHHTISNKSNPKVWLEKTPFHRFNVTEKVSFLEKTFPKAKFIHLYRNPLDVYLAFLKKHPDVWDEHKLIYDFKRNVKITKKNIEKENHFLLKYEDLILNTSDKLDQLTKFLGVNFNEVMLTPTKNGVSWHGNSVDSNKFTGISKNSLNKHLKHPKSTDIFLKIESLLKDEMNFLNYESTYSKDVKIKSSFLSAFSEYSKNRAKSDAQRFQYYRLYNFAKSVL